MYLGPAFALVSASHQQAGNRLVPHRRIVRRRHRADPGRRQAPASGVLTAEAVTPAVSPSRCPTRPTCSNVCGPATSQPHRGTGRSAWTRGYTANAVPLSHSVLRRVPITPVPLPPQKASDLRISLESPPRGPLSCGPGRVSEPVLRFVVILPVQLKRQLREKRSSLAMGTLGEGLALC